MNDLFRIMEMPPDETETMVGEPWRWDDTYHPSAGLGWQARVRFTWNAYLAKKKKKCST